MHQSSLQVNVRFLKAGLRLVPGIASLGRKCANALIKHSVMETLCHLLTAERMATTLKLLVLRAIDSLLDYPQGMERFFGWNNLVVGASTRGGVGGYSDPLWLLCQGCN